MNDNLKSLQPDREIVGILHSHYYPLHRNKVKSCNPVIWNSKQTFPTLVLWHGKGTHMVVIAKLQVNQLCWGFVLPLLYWSFPKELLHFSSWKHAVFNPSQIPPAWRSWAWLFFLQTREALNLLEVTCNKLECLLSTNPPNTYLKK